jgi:hypothetical protein
MTSRQDLYGQNIYIRCNPNDQNDNTIYYTSGDPNNWGSYQSITASEVIFRGYTVTQTSYVTFIGDIKLTNSDLYFVIGAGNVVISGMYNGVVCRFIKKFTTSVSSRLDGLFFNGDGINPTAVFQSYITISNMIYEDESGENQVNAVDYSGIFLRSYFGQGATSITIENLENRCKNLNHTSGITGSYFAYNSHNVTCRNLVNRGSLIIASSNIYVSGIFGPYSFYNTTGNVVIEDVYNYSDLPQMGQSGIFAGYCFSQTTGNLYVKINKLVNFGNFLSSPNQSGIFGEHNFNDIHLNLQITNCYNVGNKNDGATVNGISAFFNTYCFRNVYIYSTFSFPSFIKNIYNVGNFADCTGGAIVFNFLSFHNAVYEGGDFVVENIYSITDLRKNTNYLLFPSGFGTKSNSAPTSPFKLVFQNVYMVTSTHTGNFYDTGSPRHDVIVNENSLAQSNTWNATIALNALVGQVCNSSNSYNNYNLNDPNFPWFDPNPPGSSLNLPFVLCAFQDINPSTNLNNFYVAPYTNVVASTAIIPNPNTKVTSADYFYISSNSINHYSFQPIPFTTSDIPHTGVITTNVNVQSGTWKVIVYQFNIFTNNLYSGTYSINLFNSTITAFCVLGDSLVEIFDGYKVNFTEIQNCRVGDIIQTADGQRVPIKFLFKQTLKHEVPRDFGKREKDRLYVLSKDDYPELVKDLVLSGGHPIFAETYQSKEQAVEHAKIWPNARERRFGEKVKILTYCNERAKEYTKYGVYDIYNVVLENGSDIYKQYSIRVNGLLTETLSEYYYKLIFK